MAGWFTNGLCVVVAVATRSCHVGMIKISAGPTIGGVAVVTGITGLDMIARLTGCGAAVVATRASTDHSSVINMSD